MGRKKKLSTEALILACEKYLTGKGTLSSIAKELGCSKCVFSGWFHRYNKHNKNAFNTSFNNNSYSKEFKLNVIKEIESGNSIPIVAANNNITESMVRNWYKVYNAYGDVKEYNPSPEVYSMKSRKVSLEEKKEIIQYVLHNNSDYKGAALKYAVPYANVFNWVKKYKQTGEISLTDNRGRPSKGTQKVKELSDIELKDIEIQKLKNELELKDKIITILKKTRRFVNAC